ncbi:hypothetical protein [Nocardia beijingensis]|uniref:Uncharacterized protein n=1 Tax=Nocardia beijingensis TaxID=95162 RepID=A0ABW7W953_9NOCA
MFASVVTHSRNLLSAGGMSPGLDDRRGFRPDLRGVRIAEVSGKSIGTATRKHWISITGAAVERADRWREGPTIQNGKGGTMDAVEDPTNLDDRREPIPGVCVRLRCNPHRPRENYA